jgi:hypothetical protein
LLPALRSVAVPASLGIGRYYLTASYQDRLGRGSAASMNVSYVQVMPVSHLPPELQRRRQDRCLTTAWLSCTVHTV